MSISNFILQMLGIGRDTQFMGRKKPKGFITSSERTVMRSIFTV